MHDSLCHSLTGPLMCDGPYCASVSGYHQLAVQREHHLHLKPVAAHAAAINQLTCRTRPVQQLSRLHAASRRRLVQQLRPGAGSKSKPRSRQQSRRAQQLLRQRSASRRRHALLLRPSAGSRKRQRRGQSSRHALLQLRQQSASRRCAGTLCIRQ
jgi:hypothetical protein